MAGLERGARQLALPFAGAISPVRLKADPTGGALLFVRHPKARRYIIRVVADGTVRVTVPRWGSKREAARFAAREQKWIERERRRVAAENLAHTASPRAAHPGALARARHELSSRLLALAAEHGLTVTRVSIRNQQWRWGSCSPSGHICLNWRLVDMPASVRDYVMIHELMHLKRLDHSPRFWKLVAAACPGYQEARAFLRTYRA
jgi:predicted metal-dependent hydrolase